MPLSPQTKKSLSTSKTPEITQITQYESMGEKHKIHKANSEDIAEIIELLRQNKSNPISLTISDQEVSYLGQLRDFLINHPSIKTVHFASNFYRRTITDFNDGQSDDQPRERTEEGIGTKEQQSLNKTLLRKSKLITLYEELCNSKIVDIDSLITFHSKMIEMDETQKMLPIFPAYNTNQMKNVCLLKIFDFTKHLIKNIFSNSENFRNLRKTFPNEAVLNIAKIDKDKSLSAIEKTIAGFIDKHDGFFSSPPIVKELQKFTQFLDKVAQKDKEQKMVFKDTEYSPRFDFNISTTSSLNNDCDNINQSVI